MSRVENIHVANIALCIKIILQYKLHTITGIEGVGYCTSIMNFIPQ